MTTRPRQVKPARRPASKPAVPAKAAARRVARPSAKAAAPAPVGPVVAAPIKAVPVTTPQPAAVARNRKLVKPTKAAKPAKVRRKPIRDSFTMPEADFALIATLKARALSAGRETKKSELLRAGLHALAALSTPDLVAALAQLEPVKIGRPKLV